MKKNILLPITLVLILVSAYILVDQTNTPPETASAQIEETSKHEKIVEIAVEKNINGEFISGEVLITFEDPPSLPAHREAALGVFLDREGDFLSLGTGSIEVKIDVEVINDEEPVRKVNVSYTGDPVDILVTSETEIYKDITEIPELTSEDLDLGRKLITREVVLGSAEEFDNNMIIRVWGETKEGELIADVLVYEAIQ